ncbi:MAG: hypothetical protein KDC53_07570, partial [Saprospiraceae bacterium]|nr:hypothetical protein [Saprospiraceae bacterium]
MSHKYWILIAMLWSCLNTSVFSQGVGINTETIPSDAILNINSGGSKGMIPPKVSTANRPNSATTGLTIYNTTTGQYEVYDGGWHRNGGERWKDAATQGDIYHDQGQVGIGTTSPSSPLHVVAAGGVEATFEEGSSGTAAIELKVGGTSRYIHVNSAGEIGISDGGTFGNILKFSPADQTITHNGVNGGIIPAGGIIMWNGGAVPDGWALCNGQNGTPDLRDRFVVGSGSTYAAGSNGGSSAVTLDTTNLPRHAHDFAGNTGTNGAHTHNTPIRHREGVGNGAYTVFYADSNPGNTTDFTSTS